MSEERTSPTVLPTKLVADRVPALARWGLAAAFLLMGVAALVVVEQTRVWEASASAWVLNTMFAVDAEAIPGQPDIFIMGDLPWILRVTMECAVVLIIVPFLGIAAALAASGRFRPGRMVLGVVLASVVVIAVNQLRIAVIGWALARAGGDGYSWWHTIGGSVMTLVGIAGALLILWVVAIRVPRGRRDREDGDVA
ncbi:exosortase/archaeosortase family protein [Cellulosimicrobium composti]|uniref:exosortase/archaeosortase family protein n=1 Tax=Cellulosimicrobium composti TaxID=2672572 RepID=UPI00378FBADF